MTHREIAKSLIGAALLSISIATPASSYQLDILHINDYYSHVQRNRLDLKLDGQRTRVKSRGFAPLVSAFTKLRAGKTNLLNLHVGDAITGDLQYALSRVVTNSYIARGKDGYATFGTVSKRCGALDTYLYCAQSFVEQAKREGVLRKLPRSHYSTQVFINKNGVKQQAGTLTEPQKPKQLQLLYQQA